MESHPSNVQLSWQRSFLTNNDCRLSYQKHMTNVDFDKRSSKQPIRDPPFQKTQRTSQITPGTKNRADYGFKRHIVKKMNRKKKYLNFLSRTPKA